MKKASLLLTVLFMFLASSTLKAQDQSDYFAGKWDILIEGTPSGDSKMLVTLNRVDGKLTGEVARDGAAAAKIIRVEEKKDKSATIYFNSSGYDVYLFIEKKNADEVEGSMMDMFDATGKRVKE